MKNNSINHIYPAIFKQLRDFFANYVNQQEIDLIEEKDGNLHAFEIKWKQQNQKMPIAFAKAYTSASFKIIHQDNYLEYIV